ncbi:PIR Superfamily Protein [Plasmodium ovale wallikeri]|uniref:PIR Superfamily Protein n=1 Tax=Plasmodium ovale wallikeri TaxID=864142 RepID=A0A1A9AQM9_PLAOA|nr:PIR Superfamily Protein [Plasmodium ovale wallikeri]
MAHKISEEKQPPQEFYRMLENKNNLEAYKALVHDYTSVSIRNKDTLRDLGAQLIRNYKDILPKYTNMDFEKRCRYLNYWIHKEINDYKSKHEISDVISNEDDFISHVWDKLKQMEHNKCERDTNNFPIEHMKIRKELDDFCTNREIFRHQKKNTHSCNDFNEWINEKYNKYFSEDNCPKYKKIIELYTKEEGIFHISDNCTFYDIPRTFPTFRCNNRYYYAKRIKTISNCEIPGVSNNREGEQHYSAPFHSKTEIPIWTTMVIISLVLGGSFFMFFILYKFSPLGSILHNYIINKYKIRRNMDEYSAELLENSSEMFHGNSEIRSEYIGYHPI